jgi:hypothetical protein
MVLKKFYTSSGHGEGVIAFLVGWKNGLINDKMREKLFL